MNDNSYKVVDVDINEILPNRFQPRIQFDEDEILELSDSIKEHGVIQPIVVRTIGDKYEIIAGERRYKASVLAGKETVPVIIKNLNDKDSAEIALIENIQRKNLTPIEEALSYKKILDMGYLTQEGLANKLGKSQSSVANKVRLLNLSDEVQEALLDNKISERHARSLLRLKNGLQQNEMLEKIIEQRLTVRKTDEEIDKVLEGRIEEKGEVDMNNEVSQIPNVVMNTENSFDIFGNNTAPTLEVPAMPEMVSAPVVEMPSVTPVMPEVPSVPIMETPVPSMPSVGGIQFDASGNVIAAPTPEVSVMPEMVSAPVVEMPSVTPVIPEVPSVPVVETPVPSMPSVGGIQFDASGNVIAAPTPEVPAMPEMVSAPVVEMPAVTPVIPEVPQTAPIQEISNVASEINNNISTIEPIIITDYNKQYDPIMPNSNIVEDNKVDFKEIINEIRECSKRIEQFGYKIDVEEYDLSTIYQVVFKIEK